MKYLSAPTLMSESHQRRVVSSQIILNSYQTQKIFRNQLIMLH